jgi:OOP family OmpA-OmpF porin
LLSIQQRSIVCRLHRVNRKISLYLSAHARALQFSQTACTGSVAALELIHSRKNMNKLLLALLVAAMTSTAAQAEELDKYYAGVTLSSSGKSTGISRTGERVSDSGGVGTKIFGGVNLNKHVALEAGYANYGSHTLRNTGAGTSGDAQIDTSMMYLAAKGTVAINERFALFGKSGLAHTRFALTGMGEPDVRMSRLMLGVGAQVSITKQVALTLEFEHYGKAEPAPNRLYSLNKFEAGLKYSF